MPKPMAEYYQELNVVDVYDTAAQIGQEFEKIIDNYGPESVTDLMPKVIQVLEQLEILAGKNQKENAELNELKLTVERLLAEKKAKAAEKEQFERELESIEESWQAETKRLVDTVARLQDENRKLRTSLEDYQGKTDSLQTEDQVIDMVNELTEERDKLRHHNRSLEREAKQKNVDMESMQQQLERLAKLNVEYRRKTALTQRRSQTLIQEKADLQAQLHDKEQIIGVMKDSMVDAESPGSPPIAPEDKSFVGKIVIDMNDPDRPRFTLKELRQVLTERNELKTKLIEVEEELNAYRPASDETYETLSKELADKNTDSDDEDRPVQGPINRPMYPGQKESGIRKILFGGGRLSFIEKSFDFLWSPGSKSAKNKVKTKSMANSPARGATVPNY